MPFGLCNAAQTFQRFMDTVTRDLNFVFCYIDDLLVFSKNREEHARHLRILFERLAGYGLTINVAKCVFGEETVRYLGYEIDEFGTRPLPDRVRAILDYKKPNNISELRRFLGILNFYRRFIRNAARSQVLLNAYLVGARKNDKRPIVWTEESERALFESKNQLANVSLLAHPLESASLALQKDASDTSMGAVLEQFCDGRWEPLAFTRRNHHHLKRNIVRMIASYLLFSQVSNFFSS